MLTKRWRRKKDGQETSKTGCIWDVLKDSYEFASLILGKKDYKQREQHMQSYERTQVHCGWAIGYITYISWVPSNEIAKGCEQTG